jgi:hypothetical protein
MADQSDESLDLRRQIDPVGWFGPTLLDVLTLVKLCDSMQQSFVKR